MTVSTTAYATTVSGNGATTVFNFSFIADTSSTIKVTLTDVNGVQTVLNSNSYTLFINTAAVGSLWGIGGTVTYPLSGSPIPSGSTLTIERTVPYTQTVSISNQGAFYPQVVEQGLDILELELQQVQGQTLNTLRAPVVDGTLDMTLGAVAARAQKFLYFNLQGLPTFSAGVPSTTPIGAGSLVYFLSGYASLALADAAASTGGGLLLIDENVTLSGNTTLSTKVVLFAGGVITRGSNTLTFSGTVEAGNVAIMDAAGTGAVTFTNNSVINAMWFGAKGDSATDDSNPLQRWLNSLGALGIKGYLPGAPTTAYRLVTGLTHTGYLSIFGDGISSRINHTGSDVAFTLTTDRFSRLENFRIVGTSSGTGGIWNKGAQEGYLDTSVFIEGYTGVTAYCRRFSSCWTGMILGGKSNGSTNGVIFDQFLGDGVNPLNNSFNIIAHDMSNNTGIGLDYQRGFMVNIFGNDFSSTGIGVSLGRTLTAGQTLRNITLNGNYFESTHCIYIGQGATGGAQVAYVSIDKNYLAGSTDCIHLYSSDSVTVGAQSMSGTNTIDAGCTGTQWSSENNVTDNSTLGQTNYLRGNTGYLQFQTIVPNANQGLQLLNQTTTVGAGAGTLTNAPHAGDPTGYLQIKVNGAVKKVPFWDV